MISFAAEPLVVTLTDGNTAADDSEILLLGVDRSHALILVASELHWYAIDKVRVAGQMVKPEDNVEDPDEG